MKINLILLAAGNSRRFGSNKLLYPLEGKRMFEHVVDELEKIPTNTFSERIVVTQYEEVSDYTKALGYTVVMNPDSSRGISSSLSLGLEQYEADAYIFVVADQPYLKQETILGLLQCFLQSDKNMGSVITGTTPGNPTIFSNYYRKELLQLTGDQGGRKVMKKYPDDVVYYYVEEEKELQDIDCLS